MPSQQQIKFEGGMDRRSDANQVRPYELKNARVEPYGSVRAMREPEEMNDSANPKKPGGAKPWLRWNDRWFSRFSQGSNLTYTDAGGNTRNTEVLQTYDKHNGVVYVSGRDSRYETVNGTDQYVPHLYEVPPEATSFAESELRLTPPHLKKLRINNSREGTGIKGSNAVSYLVIPINARGEAGPWGYISYSPDDRDRDKRWSPQVTATVSENTSYVEFYRTREWSETADILDVLAPPSDLSYYFLERKATQNVKELSVDSDVFHVSTYDGEVLRHSYSDEKEAEESLPPTTLDRKINAWAHESVEYIVTGDEASQYIYTVDFKNIKHIGANTMFMDGRDRMIYGGVEWPTKPVQLAMVIRNYFGAGGNLYAKTFTNEYEGTTGDVLHGPRTVIPSGSTVTYPVWQGEQAVNVWKDADGDGTKVHAARMVNPSSGVYDRKQHIMDIDFDFNFPPFPGNTEVSLPDITQDEWLYEKNVALLSERFRPLEVTMEDQFQVPSGQTIRAIEPARLAEEESIATYSLYVLTDESVFVANRENDQTSLRTVNTVGVDKYHVDFLSGPRQEYEYPLVAPTKYGLTYIGTDQRVYILNGRQFQEIDQSVPNIWYSNLGQPAVADAEYSAIYNRYSDVWTRQTTDKDGNTVEYSSLTPFDIGYDQERDELMVVTFDNVWFYDFDQNEWVGNYQRNDAVSIQYLDYHSSTMVHRYDRDQTADVYELLNENGRPIEDNAVLTNPMFRSPRETKIRELVADYDPLFRENRASWGSDGDTSLTLQDSPSIEKSHFRITGEDDYSPIMIHNGKGGGKNLTTQITGVVDDGDGDDSTPDANLADPLGPVPVSPEPVRWFPPMTVRQEVASEYHGVYGGTDNDGDFSDDDLVRRTEKSYHTHPRRKKFPRINGSGHIVKMENFKSFKSLQLMIEDSDL